MWFLLVATILIHAALAQSCKVQVEQGWLQGAQLDLVTGDGQYCAFKGVPYVAPPVGRLRFKAPQPAASWEGVRNATEFGATCPQFDVVYARKYLPGKEDCLYLNIYTMDLTNDSSQLQGLLPVMIYIHGGAFKSGTGNIYGPDFLIPYGVVLVTINYRVDVLGFLNMDSTDVPGNAGMKDQVEAMRWVQRNIAKFGGDPNKVTIFGASAGSASVGYHLYSPMSKGLFKRAIMMSGAPNNEWAQSHFSRRRAFALGRELGIHTDSTDELLNALQTQPIENIINTYPAVLALDLIFKNDTVIIPFCVSVEKDFGNERFLPAPLEELIEAGKDNAADVMIGVTDFESLYFIFVQGLNSTIARCKAFPEYYVPSDLLIERIPTESLNISNTIQDYYFGSHERSSLPESNLPVFLEYLSEKSITTKVQIFIDKLKNYSGKRFFYNFSAVSERNYISNSAAVAAYRFVGAAHLDDLYYLFNMDVENPPAVNKGATSYKLLQRSCKLWTNFAKYGNPTPDPSLGIIWLEYDNLAKIFLDIGEQLKLGVQPNAKSQVFWHSIYEDSDQSSFSSKPSSLATSSSSSLATSALASSTASSLASASSVASLVSSSSILS